MTVGTPRVMVVAGMVIVMVELSVAVAMPVEVSEELELELEVAEEVEDVVVLVPVRVTVMTEVVFWAEAVPRAMMAAARTEVVVNFMVILDVLVGVERLRG